MALKALRGAAAWRFHHNYDLLCTYAWSDISKSQLKYAPARLRLDHRDRHRGARGLTQRANMTLLILVDASESVADFNWEAPPTVIVYVLRGADIANKGSRSCRAYNTRRGHCEQQDEFHHSERVSHPAGAAVQPGPADPRVLAVSIIPAQVHALRARYTASGTTHQHYAV